MSAVFSVTIETTASGTRDIGETAREADVRLARSLCECDHKRILHYADGGVRAAKFDWRGGTGPCRHGKGCSCRAFVPVRRSVSEGARDE